MPDTAALSRDPATGTEIERFPFLDDPGTGRLLDRAAAGFARWRDTAMAERVAVYRALAAALRDRGNELAATITAEMGKPLGEARAEIAKCADTVDWYAANGPALLADEPAGTDTADEAYVSFLPVGTVLGIMPWNFPFWQAVRACVPIMLCGNGFLLKHAPNVTRCALLMAELWRDAGLPDAAFAVLNVDAPAVEAVIADGRIAGVTLTGSVRAGSAVAAIAGRHLKKSVLELGGIDPFIVLADADLDAAVEFAVRGRFANAGQVCLAAKRIILERPVADAFTARFVAAVRRLRVGNGRDEHTDIGPLARADLRDGVHDQVRRSVAAGAELLCGGEPVPGEGYFYPPTVLNGVRPGMAAFDEEVFGPVAALSVADDAEDALALANRSEYGLSGNIWTADVDRARALARRLESGGAFINGFTASNPRVPVGGIKKSGYGRELSHMGIREFTNAQTVWIRAAS